MWIDKREGTEKKQQPGAVLALYRAGEPGIFDPKPEFLVERWISGTDGRFSELEKLNGTIPDGYQHGDYRPHEITGLESGDYWLAEEIAPDYYTRAEPVSITYELDQEFTLVVLENQEVKGKLKIRKEGEHGELLAGAVFQLQAFQQPEWSGWSLWNCLLCHRKLRPMTQKTLRGIALRQSGRVSLKRPAAGGESCEQDSILSFFM